MSTFLRTSSGLFLQVGGSCLSVLETPPEPSDEVQIGNQIWKTKNLAIDDGQGGIYTRTVNYGQGDVTEYYYTWDAAARVAASISGWHLPTLSELQTLISNAGGSSIAGKQTKSTYGWYNDGNGDNLYGLTIFPAGYWYNDAFFDEYKRAIFWTSTKRTSTRPYAYNATYGSNSLSYDSYSDITQGLSVRLIKDA